MHVLRTRWGSSARDGASSVLSAADIAVGRRLLGFVGLWVGEEEEREKVLDLERSE
jgi:hypothetical protein